MKNLPQVKLLKWPVKDPIPTLEYSEDCVLLHTLVWSIAESHQDGSLLWTQYSE